MRSRNRATLATFGALATLGSLAALASCDPPTTLVVCHNSNCAEPADPEHDDTLGAMRESLALTVDGRPAIDGMEMDSLYRGSDGACLFAHDFENAELAPATAPAMLLAEHFAEPGPIAYSSPVFRVELELKPEVSTASAGGDDHTPAQRLAHARCAWDIYNVIAAGAIANGRDIEVVFASFSPELLRAVLDAAPLAPPVPVLYGAEQGIPKPLDGSTRSLRDYRGLPIAEVEFHDQWIYDAQYEAIRTQGIDVAFFMFSATAETFALVNRYHPTMVVTSEARLFRRWLER